MWKALLVYTKLSNPWPHSLANHAVVARRIELTAFSCSSCRFVGLNSFFHQLSALPSGKQFMWPIHLQYRLEKD